MIHAGNKIGARFQTGHFGRLHQNNEPGDNVSIGTGVTIEHHVRIEDGVHIQLQAFIPKYSILKKVAWIGSNVVLTNTKYFNRLDTKDHLESVRVGKGAIVGADVTILRDVRIGDGATIGASAVVVTDVEAGQFMWATSPLG